MMPALAGLLPYLLAAACLAAGVAWVVRGKRSGSAAAGSGRPLTQLGAREFEALVRAAFQLQGYKLIEGRQSATEGDELVLRRDRETVLVQCKHWRAGKVGAEAVHALQRAMAARGAGAGFVLTTGRFAREALAAAAACNVRLIDGPALPALLDKARAAQGRTCAADTSSA